MRQDYSRPLSQEIDQPRRESLALKLSFYGLAILVGVMFAVAL